MIKNIEDLETQIAPLKSELFSHSLYASLTDIESLKCFMAHHVYAVWDFMNLLSYLQSIYTSVSAPWSPPKFPKIARLINEIKLEEESDIIDGTVTSHFDFYMLAMKNLGITLDTAETFIAQLKHTTYEAAISDNSVPKSVHLFLAHTQKAIEAGPVSAAASFTFGRETIIPNMFLNILENTPLTPKLEGFKAYIERHIELDGGEHAGLSRQLITEICGDNVHLWQEATNTAISAIQARIDFYSSIEIEIKKKHSP